MPAKASPPRKTVEMSLADITIEPSLQMRSTGLVESVADEYAERLDALPPGRVVTDGTTNWLVGGFHRHRARVKAGATTMPVELSEGTWADAVWEAADENNAHGLRLTSADKRAKVRTVLLTLYKRSNAQIAERCHVDGKTVATIREEMERHKEIPYEAARTDINGNATPARKPRPPKAGSQVKATDDEFPQNPSPESPQQHGDDTSQPDPGEPAPTPSPAPESQDPGELKDHFGNPIPKRCRAAWCDPWIQSAIDTLATVAGTFRKARLADGMSKRVKHYPFFEKKDFIDGCGMVDHTLDLLLDHLKAGRPAGVCPTCQGKGCTDCGMSGLVPREVYEKLSKEAS
jgi:hypothetical protein